MQNRIVRIIFHAAFAISFVASAAIHPKGGRCVAIRLALEQLAAKAKVDVVFVEDPKAVGGCDVSSMTNIIVKPFSEMTVKNGYFYDRHSQRRGMTYRVNFFREIDVAKAQLSCAYNPGGIPNDSAVYFNFVAFEGSWKLAE